MSDFAGVQAIIIDDDPTSISVLKKLLDQLEVETFVIKDTFNIENDLGNLPVPHIIFLDLEMPKHNGYDVLQLLQSVSDYANVPIVAYTTHTSHLNDARTAGFHSFLGKPLSNRTFPEQLGRILSGEKVWEVL